MLIGTWRVLYLYFPATDLASLAEELGAASCAARSLEVEVPPFAADRVLGRFGLELDELVLTVGKRLLLAHSDLDIPPRGPSACEAAPLRALLLEGVGLAEMAAELD